MIKEAVKNYSVDELGNVYSRWGRLLKCSLNGNGYKQVYCYKSGKLERTYLVHRLVWMAFKGEIPEGLEIDHIDGNRSNNRLDNLRVVTHQHNMLNMTKVKGYSYFKEKDIWIARIFYNGKNHHIGCYKTEEAAAKAYKEEKAKVHIIVEVDRGDK